MTDFAIDPTHSSSGDGDGWADQTGAGGACNSVPNAVTAGLGANDIGYIRHIKTDLAVSETWSGPTANQGLPAVLLGVKAATTTFPPVNADLIDGMWEGSADPAWDTPAEVLPGVTTSASITIQGAWFIYAVNIDPAATLSLGASSNDGEQTYVECSLSAGTSASSRSITFGSSGAEQAQKITLVNTEVVSTRAAWTLELFRSGVVCILGGKLTATIAPTSIFEVTVADLGLYANGFDMSAVGSGVIITITSGIRSLQAKFVNCAKGSGALVTGSDNPSPWRIESYNTDANPGTTLTSSDAILDLEIQDQKGECVQDEADFRTAGALDGAGNNYSLALKCTSGNFTQPYRGMEGPWNMLRVGSGLETTMTVHIANNISGDVDVNDDDIRIEVMQPNGDGDLAANEYKFKGMSLLGTPAAITNGTDGDWTFINGSNAQEIAVTLDPAYQGNIWWRPIVYTIDTIFVDPKAVLS